MQPRHRSRMLPERQDLAAMLLLRTQAIKDKSNGNEQYILKECQGKPDKP